MSELGKLHHQQGKFEEASKLSERSFEIRKASYGDECAHLYITNSLNNLGGEYLDQGEQEEYWKYMRGALR